MLPQGIAAKQTRTFHERRYKSRPKSEREIHDGKLASWLAQKKLTYAVFGTMHRKASGVAKGTKCTDGGWWKDFRTKLRTGMQPACRMCQVIMSKHGITLDGVADMLNEDCPTAPSQVDAPMPVQDAQDAHDAQDAQDAQMSCNFLWRM